MPGTVHGEPAVMAPTAPHGWREAFGTIVYGIGILIGIFVFPKAAAAAYLLVALRGVLVAGTRAGSRCGQVLGPGLRHPNWVGVFCASSYGERGGGGPSTIRRRRCSVRAAWRSCREDDL